MIFGEKPGRVPGLSAREAYFPKLDYFFGLAFFLFSVIGTFRQSRP
jgi:hypothetical protein